MKNSAPIDIDADTGTVLPRIVRPVRLAAETPATNNANTPNPMVLVGLLVAGFAAGVLWSNMERELISENED